MDGKPESGARFHVQVTFRMIGCGETLKTLKELRCLPTRETMVNDNRNTGPSSLLQALVQDSH